MTKLSTRLQKMSCLVTRTTRYLRTSIVHDIKSSKKRIQVKHKMKSAIIDKEETTYEMKELDVNNKVDFDESNKVYVCGKFVRANRYCKNKRCCDRFPAYSKRHGIFSGCKIHFQWKEKRAALKYKYNDDEAYWK
jgi:hypothetical protein